MSCAAKEEDFKTYSFTKDGQLDQLLYVTKGLYCSYCEQSMFGEWRPWKCKDKVKVYKL